MLFKTTERRQLVLIQSLHTCPCLKVLLLNPLGLLRLLRLLRLLLPSLGWSSWRSRDPTCVVWRCRFGCILRQSSLARRLLMASSMRASSFNVPEPHIRQVYHLTLIMVKCFFSHQVLAYLLQETLFWLLFLLLPTRNAAEGTIRLIILKGRFVLELSNFPRLVEGVTLLLLDPGLIILWT